MQQALSSSRIALVTGAGSGIGRACALALLAEGWTVWLAGRRLPALQETARLAGQAAAARVHPFEADVGEPQDVQRLFDVIRATHGRLDLLFNNAGIFPPAAAPEAVALEDWQRAVQTNLNGAFYCLRAAFALMKTQQPRGGRIINNGSISAHAPRPGSIAYTATKHAITGLTKAAALDGRAFDIAVGQLDIGNVASDMTERMAAGVLQADGSVRPEPRMDMDAVVQTFMTMARLPLQANVLFATVMATRMPFVGRG
ncbi:putative oxidoreductase [Tepidimonas sediminis]|uniref:Putative oxidoreductase n=1 Tax=Tepidimonas sediminis TaxID=2588941 RepID=A0A554WML7_9BURK|nr:SDR family oxidoreductase [Tepidimonas sediminis]TSE24822.1 putative oxidoreductase [Tepidimonas sediminis]